MDCANTLEKACESLNLEKISLLNKGALSWLCKNRSNELFVLKYLYEEEDSHSILRALKALYTPFLFPHPITDMEDDFILYPWIEGKTLDTSDPLDDNKICNRVVELAGRIQALLRSLHLVPYFEKKSNPKMAEETPGENIFQKASINFGCSPTLDAGIKKARRYEVATSYHWVKRNLDRWKSFVVASGVWDKESFNHFKGILEEYPAIHFPIMGNNLAHWKFTPDHIVSCSTGDFGVLSWQIHPRPRRYMPFTFLAWALFHTEMPDVYERFSKVAPSFFTKYFRQENLIVLNICILEQAYRFSQMDIDTLDDALVEEKLHCANRLLSEGLARIRAGQV